MDFGHSHLYATMVYMKKSIFSILSLIIGVWLVLAVLVGVGVTQSLYGSFESPLFILWVPFMFFPYAEIVWAVIAVVLGVIGIIRQESKRALAIIGIILTLGVTIYSIATARQYEEEHMQALPSVQNEPLY